MAARLAIELVTLGDLRAGGDARLRTPEVDPDGLAVLPPHKRDALLANPLGRDDDPAQLVGLADGKVIGKVDLFAGEITLDGAPVRVLWGSALGVPEQHRATGIGLMLAMRMQALGAWIGAFGVSQIAVPLYSNLRWTDLSLPRYVLVRRSRRFLAAFLGSDVLAAILAPLADLLFALQRAWLRAAEPVHRRYALVPAARMPEDLAGGFAAHAEKLGGAMPHRSPAWVNWLLSTEFNEVASRRTNLWLVRHRSTGAIAGYILTKQRHFDDVTQRHVRNVTIASVQDWMSFDPADLPDHQLLALAISAATRPNDHAGEDGVGENGAGRDGRAAGGGRAASKADAVEICTAVPDSRRTLRRWGLLPMGQLNFLCRPARGTELADDKWRDVENWRLRPAEGDNFWT